MRGKGSLVGAAARVGKATDGGTLEARLRELGARLLPPEPQDRDGKPLTYEIPAPLRLEATLTEPQRVERCAAAYRAVLLRRFGIKSAYMRRSALEPHAHYARLAVLSLSMQEARIAPLAWVIFSFDRWTHTPRGKDKRSPPPAKWVWSPKRWKEQRAWLEEERYDAVELRTAPEAQALYTDWRNLWIELMQRAPETREELAAIVDRWFPGNSWEQRLARARTQTWDYQARVQRELAAGGWPWL